MNVVCMKLVFMNIKFLVDSVHAPGIKENQHYENVDRTLLRKPETQFKTTDSNLIKLVDQQYAEAIGANKPDEKTGCNEP